METASGPRVQGTENQYQSADVERGRLKIFFGACPGVGKTWAMLQAMRRQRDSGVDVAIGEIDTHGSETLRRLVEGLPALPPKHVHHHERMLRVFDVDGALAARPCLVAIDELARANVPGGRHAKRWQDVDELLAAGIDVYATLDVAQLESLGDTVSNMTGVRVRESVPDRFFFDAADVVLIDVPADDLLARLLSGSARLTAAAESARSYLVRANLLALRELALRCVADRANADVHGQRLKGRLRTASATRERILVGVRAEPSHERLIHEGARLAQHLRAEWIVVHVDQPADVRDPHARETLLSLANLADSLGAEFANLPGEDVASTLAGYAHERGATRLVLGSDPPRARWRAISAALCGARIAERVVRANPRLGLVVVGTSVAQAAPAKLLAQRRADTPLNGLILAVIACALTTLIASALLHFFATPNVVMLFMLNVVLLSLRLGRLAGAWAALLSVGSFDFFFVEPRFSFAVSDTQYLFTFVLMLTVALVTSQLASRLRYKAKVATAGERRATAVARVARDLSSAIRPAQIAAVCRQTIAPLFDAQVALVLPDPKDSTLRDAADEFVDTSVAQWTYDHAEAAGAGTQTLSGTRALYLPLKGPICTRGVLAICAEQGELSNDADDRRLLDACCVLIALALERTHFIEIAQDTQVRMEGERLRNALLSAVSHDLKTPLTAIRGLAETLEQVGDLPDTERTAVSRSIRLQTEELHRLVTNLLDLARMQSEGVRLNKEWHALGEIAGSALARLGTTLAAHRVRTELPADLPLIEIDAIAFERVFVNLIDNAVKYTPAGSTIQIRARAVGDTMHLFIEDDGPGLPNVDPERFFEAFTRGVRESTISGVGLGLALCRTIVDAHEGAIDVERRLPQGTRFEIRLPLGAPPVIEEERGT
ncbi:sensor histidine kinase [Paraburkholderia rhizosphaerae]|uniref:histidine kinase n=1 Tax=Paraburkholderia rhizosphaerae TaxID=480658 RepID=A0A4R8LT42_9BURK|nr:sensor histidine kinase KdpD [Paraburkholderia rhizosphaerae]TDY50859.1 two-component system sensor histidine kinase KdpD [Paraburkholderia rhizosphaerae]